LRELVVAGVGGQAGGGGALDEGGGIDRQAAGGDGDALVVAIEKIEGVGGEVDTVAVSDVDFASEAKICGGVVGAGESVAGGSREGGR
jgi:hypothetical protein